jgi:MFS family permease
LAVVAYFAVPGLANGVWLARIPAVKQGLHLSDGVLGVALLAAPAGLVVAVPIASRVMRRSGSRRPTIVGGICAALIPIGFGFAPNLAALMAALFGFGLSGGLLDIGMNSQAVLVERGVGRPLMTSFHSCFSFGALAGALLGGAFAWAGISAAVNFTVVDIPLACVAVLTSWWLIDDKDGNGAGPTALARPVGQDQGDDSLGSGAGLAPPPGQAGGQPDQGRPRVGLALVLMAVLATCSLLGEGAADGWSAVYLRDNLAASAGLAALAYAGFSVAMAFGRLSGDKLAARFGAGRLMRWCGLTAALGLALALLSGSPAGAIAGFTVFGAGLSCTFPLLLSAAGNVDRDRPSHGIARVAGSGYVGMLAGPVLIGGLASAFGLQRALVVPALLALVVAAGAGVLTPRR